jgi:3'-5' exoribonuclease
MKKQFVNMIKAGDAVDEIFVLAEKILSQKKDGNNFLNVRLSDKTGKIKGVIWDNVDDISLKVSSGNFVHVKANVCEYRDMLQLVIKSMTPCSVESVDPSDFLPVTSLNVNDLFDRLVKKTESLQNDHLKQLFKAFWDDKLFVRDFKRAPAAKNMHHAYLGGLLVHTVSMVFLADKIAEHYKGGGVDRDLLIAGAILHDIGKLREFEYQYKIDYSDEGRLLSHIVIGLKMIDEKLNKIPNFPKDLEILLKHLVVSHHGSREFGSPEIPKTIEAVLLNYVDEIDSKVNGIRDFIAQEDSNENWTSYHKLLGRHFYTGSIG